MTSLAIAEVGSWTTVYRLYLHLQSALQNAGDDPAARGTSDDWRVETETARIAVCGGRVVILLYCPSCFLMETGLYRYLRQISLFADVNRALMSFLSVYCLCPGPGCALTADNAVIRDDRSIDRRRAEWPPTNWTGAF